MQTKTLITAACLMTALLDPNVSAQETVRKYEMADGSVLYTDRPPALIEQPGMTLLEVKVFKPYRYARAPRPLTAARRDAYDSFIASAANAWNLDFALIKAIMHAESLFDPDAVSLAGARGLMQLMPGTARELGVRDPSDPQENIGGGARYLRMMLDRYDDDMELALAAYNAGPGNVDRYEGIPPFSETQEYVQFVTSLVPQYTAQ